MPIKGLNRKRLILGILSAVCSPDVEDMIKNKLKVIANLIFFKECLFIIKLILNKFSKEKKAYS
jgi:hypothetical protein